MIGKGTNCHPHARIFPGAKLGENCRIENNVTIYPNVYIGNNVYIAPGATIGAPPEHPDYDPRTYRGAGVIIEDNVRIRENVTVQSGIERPTTIGYSCHLQAHSHVGHDCNVAHFVTIACGAKIGGHSVLHEYSYVGLNAVLHQRSILGMGALIGASGFAKGEMEDWGLFVGVPVTRIGWNQRLREKLGMEPYNPNRSGLDNQKPIERPNDEV